MLEYKYLIIGGGMTAEAAVRGIRKRDPLGSIGLISTERHPPYNRPPLSKALWKGEPEDSVWRKIPTDGVTLHLSITVKSIDKENKRVTDDRGTLYSFQKLLLATGGSVRRLPYNVDGIIYFRTLDDYHQLRKDAERRQTFAVIGGGFIGTEIAAALAMNNKTVTMIFPDDGIGARVYPRELSQFITSYYRSKGVQVLHSESVTNISRTGPSYAITTSGGKELKVDGVVAGIGIQPNVELAQAAGLSVDNGILVDEFLRTSHPDVYAAGDVANFYNAALGKRIRVEHEDNANVMGELAGVNMAGDSDEYRHLPFFYSDLFDLGYEGIGELDSRLETVEDWKEPHREGVVYYLQRERVRGMLLWNTWGQVDAARSLIGEKGPFNARNLKGRLPA